MTFKFKILGDPHLGRSFIHGVPLHRRGEREELVWKQFEKELIIPDVETNLHINMGDLFDKSIVPYDVIVRASNAYKAAAKKANRCTFIILKGNHDWMRDLDRVSAFDMFAKLVAGVDNIKVISKIERFEDFLFVPYDPINPTAELVAAQDYSSCRIAFGHWDKDGFGTDHNVVPTAVLNKHGILHAVTGHVHKAEVFTRDNVNVTIVGSMQPYAFGEQSDDTFYVEHTLETLKAAGDLTNKVVRINLAPGDILEDSIDCLQLVVKRHTAEGDDAPVVTMGDFDMEALFKKAFAAAGVSNDLTEKLIGKYNDQRLYASD